VRHRSGGPWELTGIACGMPLVYETLRFDALRKGTRG